MFTRPYQSSFYQDLFFCQKFLPSTVLSSSLPVKLLYGGDCCRANSSFLCKLSDATDLHLRRTWPKQHGGCWCWRQQVTDDGNKNVDHPCSFFLTSISTRGIFYAQDNNACKIIKINFKNSRNTPSSLLFPTLNCLQEEGGQPTFFKLLTHIQKSQFSLYSFVRPHTLEHVGDDGCPRCAHTDTCCGGVVQTVCGSWHFEDLLSLTLVAE